MPFRRRVSYSAMLICSPSASTRSASAGGSTAHAVDLLPCGGGSVAVVVGDVGRRRDTVFDDVTRTVHELFRGSATRTMSSAPGNSPRSSSSR